MKLLNDISRCQDITCKKHQTCERWLQRSEGRIQIATLRGVGECKQFIELKEAEIDLMGECE